MASIYDYGLLFHKWHIKKRLGYGGFGEVYEIYEETNGITQRAAVKCIPIPKERLEEDPTLLKRVTSEIEIMQKLRGANHIVIIDDYEILKWKQIKGRRQDEGKDVLIRMELLVSLESILKKSMLSHKEVIKLGIHICTALESCKKYNVIHRDIKPANILKSEHSDYKLGDFGLARVLEGKNSLSRGVGTLGYFAPEVAFNRKYDLRVDICSLGLAMYQLLNNNKLPFQDEGDDFDTRRIIDREPIPPLGDAIPDWLADIVMKACEYEPEDRYKNPTKMREALEKGNRNNESEHDVDQKQQVSEVIQLPQLPDTQPQILLQSMTDSLQQQLPLFSQDEVTEIMRENADIIILAEAVEIPRKVLTREEAGKLTGEHIVIPHGYTEIGEDAFRGREDIISVKVPNSTTSIGRWAFSYCRKLASIEIPNSVTSIGMRAFYYCIRLKSIEMPNNVTSIGEWAFNFCIRLKSIEMPNNVTSIGEWAFNDCWGLTSVTIPDRVEFIGEYAFRGCEELTIHCSRNSYAYKYCVENYVKMNNGGIR